MTAPEMVMTRVNDRWDLLLPKHRAERPGWPWWERDALHALWCCIRPGDVVWDIGAEEGDLACLYASWGAKVCMVEPSPEAWPWIRATFEANDLADKVSAMYCTLVAPKTNGFEAGMERFKSPAAGLWHNWPDAADGPLVPDHGFRHLSEALTEMPRIALDDLARLPTGRPESYTSFEPDVIVMDIEGAEYQALLGAEVLLHEIRPTFAISVHPEFMRERYRDTPDDLLVLMELAGYEARYLGFTHEYHWIFKPRP